MCEQLDAAGLAYERIEAVDGRELDAVEPVRGFSPELNRRSYPRLLSRGEIACYLSHLQALRRLVETGAPAAVILEDDVVLGPDFCEALAAAARSATPWDVVKLGSISRKPVRAAEPLGRYRVCRYHKVPISGFAHLVSRAGAQRLLARRVPFGRPFDVDLQHVWETGLEVVGLEPYPVTVRPVASDIRSCGMAPPSRLRLVGPPMARLGFGLRRLRHALATGGPAIVFMSMIQRGG